MGKDHSFSEMLYQMERMLAGLKLHEQTLSPKLKDLLDTLKSGIPKTRTLDDEQEQAFAVARQKTAELNEFLSGIWQDHRNGIKILKGELGDRNEELLDYGISPRKEAEPMAPPGEPADLEVIKLTADSVSLKCSSSKRKRVYEWWRATGSKFYKPGEAMMNHSSPGQPPPASSYTIIATTVEREWTDNDVETGYTYWYRVRAVNAGGESNFTEPVAATPVY